MTFLDRKRRAPIAIPASGVEAGRMEVPECARNNTAPLSCEGGHLSHSPHAALEPHCDLWQPPAFGLLIYRMGACNVSSTSKACCKALRWKMLEKSKNTMAVKIWRCLDRKSQREAPGIYPRSNKAHSFPVRLCHLGGNESRRGDFLFHMCSRKTLHYCLKYK